MEDTKDTQDTPKDTPKDTQIEPKKRVGRPRKTEIAAKKNKGQVGRPKGDAAIINDYKARMLASPKSKKVMDVIFDAALNDDHKNQAAAWKLIADRIIPVSVFEQDIKRSGGKSAITINISGIGEGVNICENTLDGEYENISNLTEEDDYANG